MTTLRDEVPARPQTPAQPAPGAGRLGWRRSPWTWLGLAGYAWLAGTFRTFTPSAALAALLAGGLAALVFLPGRRAATRAGFAPLAWAAWLFVVLALGGWEAWAFLLGSPHDHPTLSTLINSWMHGADKRRIVYFGWLSFGVWLQGLRR